MKYRKAWLKDVHRRISIWIRSCNIKSIFKKYTIFCKLDEINGHEVNKIGSVWKSHIILCGRNFCWRIQQMHRIQWSSNWENTQLTSFMWVVLASEITNIWWKSVQSKIDWHNVLISKHLIDTLLKRTWLRQILLDFQQNCLENSLSACNSILQFGAKDAENIRRDFV